MFTTVWKVDSKRIGDVSLAEGKTVGNLRRMLYGKDVKDAYAKVLRASKGPLIGKTDGYVLKDGDTVEFITRSTKLPNLTREPETTGNPAVDLANKLTADAARELEKGTTGHRAFAQSLMEMARMVAEDADFRECAGKDEPSVKVKDDCGDKCGCGCRPRASRGFCVFMSI